MQEVLGEVDDVNEEEMGDECDQHNIDAASGFGNLEMGRLGDSQEGLEDNGSDKEEQVNDEHPIDKHDTVSKSVDQTGEGSFGNGAGPSFNHSEDGSAPNPMG